MQVSVLVLPYDSQGMTLEVLFSLAERVIRGRMLQSVGILVPGSTDDITLTDGNSSGLMQHFILLTNYI